FRRAVRDRRHAQLVLTVRPVDPVREPAAVRRQAAMVGCGDEPFPPAEIRGRGRMGRALPLDLARGSPERVEGLQEDRGGEKRQHLHLKISFGIFTCTPTLPSTSCVMWTLPAILVN